MKWSLTHNDKILTLIEATSLEIDQLNLTFEKEVANARWDPRVKKGWWNGKISYFKSNRYLPSGLWNEVVEICKQYNFELHIDGIDRKFDKSIDMDSFQEWVDEKWSNAEMKPRDYQVATAFNIVKYQNCLAELATSAGKTLITYMTLAYLLDTKKSNKILMIVPTVDLVVQGTEDFYQYNTESCDLKLEIQQIFAGSILRKNSNIVIGTYQSLVKKDKSYFDDFDTVITDECLHPDTMISMSDGTFKKISEVNEGDLVLTTNDDTLEIESKEVDFVYHNLSKGNQMFELEMEDGTILRVTGNHKVKLITGEYKRVDELTLDDEILDN
jgi:hypothetical protein